MAHDDLTREDLVETGPETAAPSADGVSEHERAMEIFKAREFEGEALRMGQVLRRVRETLSATKRAPPEAEVSTIWKSSSR